MKRLICCFDGTWNDDKTEETLTNVVKLHRAIRSADANGIEQRSHYVVGIATDTTGTRQFLVGAAGLEAGARVKAGYRFLAENYEAGDEIYLFGFSRGAFEARGLGGLIGLTGLGKREAAFSLDEAWDAYRHHRSQPAPEKLDNLRKAAHYPVPIKCIGVWDTVGNIADPLLPDAAFPDLFAFHNTRLSERVEVGLHALSIDEPRGPFSPIMWTAPKGAGLPKTQHIEQVWFAGTHADVGGGWKETALSDIGLLWMAERASLTTGLAFDRGQLERSTRPDPLGLQHSPATGKILKLSERLPFVRLIKQDMRGLSFFRRMFWGTWRTSKILGGEVPVNESVHESALARFGKPVKQAHADEIRDIIYRPRSVKPIAKTR